MNPCFNETTHVGTWNQTEGNTAAQVIAGLTVPNQLQTVASAQARLASVRIERRDDDGTLIGAAEAPFTGAWLNSPIASKPIQTSIVLSLRSNTPGASGRGRLYWPALGAGIDAATMRLSTPSAALISSAASSYLDLIETTLKERLHPSPSLIDFKLCVVSPTRGTRTDITRIEVGDILDVQRRRRDKLAESYQTAVYPPAA